MALGIAFALPVCAQNPVNNNPDNKPYWGIRVGADIVDPGSIEWADGVGISLFSNGAGIEFGGIFNAPIVANFYLEPGLKLYYDTYSAKNISFIDDDFESGYLKDSFRKFGFRIPVMAGYHFDFTEDIKVALFTGPELEVGLSGKEHIKGGNVKVSQDLYGDEGGMRRVNLLWDFGASVSYKHFYFGVNGGIGMLNMTSVPDISFHENRVTFSLGYNF